MNSLNANARMKKKLAGRVGAQPVLVAPANRVRFSGPAQSSMVSHPRCSYPIPCGKCHYCLRAEHGPEYWLRGGL